MNNIIFTVKMAKLPKWAIRQAGGINKKAWRLARQGRGKSPRKTTTTKKKVVRNTSKRNNNYFTKTFWDGAISGGGKVAIRKVAGHNPLLEAGFDIVLGIFRKNKTLVGQGIVNGATAFIPSMNLLSGLTQQPK